MKDSNSRECRNCHSIASMDPHKQTVAARISLKQQKNGATCIDCHRGIAHQLPKISDEDEPAEKKKSCFRLLQLVRHVIVAVTGATRRCHWLTVKFHLTSKAASKGGLFVCNDRQPCRAASRACLEQLTSTYPSFGAAGNSAARTGKFTCQNQNHRWMRFSVQIAQHSRHGRRRCAGRLNRPTCREYMQAHPMRLDRGRLYLSRRIEDSNRPSYWRRKA